MNNLCLYSMDYNIRNVCLHGCYSYNNDIKLIIYSGILWEQYIHVLLKQCLLSNMCKAQAAFQSNVDEIQTVDRWLILNIDGIGETVSGICQYKVLLMFT